MILSLPESQFGTAIGPACVYSEKRPGRAQAETTSRAGPNARPLLAPHLAFRAFTVKFRPGSAAARPGLIFTVNGVLKGGSDRITWDNNTK